MGDLDGSINDVVEQNSKVIKDRITRDVIVNEKLLQLCRSTNLYILNGRIGPMPEGRCTCQTARGQSVVDYIIASVDLLLLTKSFQIGETSPLSVHRCVTATLQCKYNNSSNMHASKSKPTDRQVVLYKWKDEHKEQYVKNLNTLHVQHLLNNIRYSILSNNVISPNEHIEALNEVIRTSAAPCRVVFSGHRTNKSVHSAPWYDESCKIQRLEYNKQRNKYNKTHAEEDK